MSPRNEENAEVFDFGLYMAFLHTLCALFRRVNKQIRPYAAPVAGDFNEAASENPENFW
jgi:hypothetical protein